MRAPARVLLATGSIEPILRVTDASHDRCSLYRERAEEHIEQLGWHALRGELWEQAVDYNRRAGARAYMRPAYSEAVTFFERAIEAVEHLPVGPKTLELAVDLRMQLRTSLGNAGQPDRSLDVCREAIERADALGDPKRPAGAAAGLTNSLYIAGRSSEALDAGLRALALAEPFGDLSLLVMARWYLAQACEAVGDHARVIDTMEANLDLFRQHPGLSAPRSLFRGMSEVVSRGWLATSLAQRGEFDRAAVAAQPAIGLGEHSGSPWGVVAGLSGASVMHLCRGELNAAIPYLERGLDLCTSSGLRVWFPIYAASLGYAYALGGRFVEARDLLCRAVDAGATEERVHQPRWLAWLGETHLLSGDLEQAASMGSTALEMARVRGERGNEVWALRLQGEIAAAADPPSVTMAEMCYHEARALAEQLGMRPLVAHCHLGLGRLYRRTGKRAQAHEHLSTATTMYREMDMRFWLKNAQREVKDSR